MGEPPLAPLEVAVLEANAVALGSSIDSLMENAGKVVAEEAARHLPPPPSKVGILCGVGNNGGDGMMAGIHLREWGYQPEIWLLRPAGEIRGSAARRRWERASASIPVHIGCPEPATLASFPLWIDAMLGTGSRGDLREPYASAVRELSVSRVPVLSVDLPTGLGTSNPLVPKWTVALEVLKNGMNPETCGEIVVRSIGMPPEAHRRTGPGEFLLFPRPGPRTHKGEMGRLVIVGGGPYAGAPALAGLAALRAGVDMVFILAPAPTASVIQSFSPNLIVRAVGTEGRFGPPDGKELAREALSRHPDALLVGNGAGRDPGTLEALRTLVREVHSRIPLVLDADGLSLADPSRDPPWRDGSPDHLLLTPNGREFARLLGRAEETSPRAGTEATEGLARRLRATLLQKGPEDVISDGTRTKVNGTHHPAMAVGGAGDVLAGVAASLLARRLTAFQAGRLAAYWVGLTAVRLFPERSFGMMATDLLEGLPGTLAAGLQALEDLQGTSDGARGEGLPPVTRTGPVP